MLKNLFIPNQKNNHTPRLLHRNALLIYVLVIFGFNIFLGQAGVLKVGADITPQDLLNAHNAQRSVSGLAPLTLNTSLNSSAGSKASTMIAIDCWAHYCPPDKSPWDFFLESGYNYQFAGENLAEGFDNIDSIVSAWMNSPTHRANILNENYREVGFGFAYGYYQGKPNNLLVTVHFGTAFSSATIIEPSQPVNFPDVAVAETENNKPTSGPYITIDNLTEGQYINSRSIEITGKAEPIGQQISLSINDIEDGKINAPGINYTFRSSKDAADGSYKVQAKLLNLEGQVLSETTPMNVIVDGNLPSVNKDTIQVIRLTPEKFLVKFKTSADVKDVSANILNYQVNRDDQMFWSVLLDKTEINKVNNVLFTVKDFFENSQQFFIPTSEIFAVKTSTDNLTSTTEINEAAVDLNVPEMFLDRIGDYGIRQILPLLFVLYLIGLFTIDFIVLSKTHMIGVVRRKSHVYMGIFVVLFLVISIGGFSGNIMQGLNT